MTADAALLRQLTHGPGTPLVQALQVLAAAPEKIVLVTDPADRLLGVITDYDIRRALLRNISFDRPIRDVMNRRPVVVRDGLPDAAVVEVMRRSYCDQVPVVDAGGRLVGLKLRSAFGPQAVPRDERVAVVMAGGLGTRLRPITERIPKPLLRLGEKPILFDLLDQILTAYFDRIYLTLWYKSEMIIEAVRAVPEYRERVEFVVECEPLGTAGSLGLLPRRPKAPFLVVNADLVMELPLREMLRYHGLEGNAVTIAIKRETYVVPYGVAVLDRSRIVALKEKPRYELPVNTGVYIVEPAALDQVPAGTVFDMTDLVNLLLAQKQRVGSFPLHEHWRDIGTHEQYATAIREYRDRAEAPAEP